MTTVGAALLRLLLGCGFAVAAVGWLFVTEPGHRVLLEVGGRQLTRLDAAATPLLVTASLLVALAVVGRQAKPATTATVWFVLAGVVGWVGMWWVSSEPLGEGEVLAKVSETHGLTQSDLLALPFLLIAGSCGVAGLVELARSSRRPPHSDPRTHPVPV